MFNPTEADERDYLDEIIQKLEQTYHNVSEQVNRHQDELREQKAYMYENKAGMDAAEKASVKQSVNMQAISGEAAVAYKERLLKLMKTPYFGRIDFREDGKKVADPIYVGMYSYFDEDENANLIHDWRAPVSGMFYDFEPGKASFQAPSGYKEGEIDRKRQFRIVEGEMEMMLESDLYIRDDVLQKELSRSADDKMKNIVATIQRDQNAIIRDEVSKELIIQGVAGSGKTSIALHRIAFLLYRYKDSLSSRDIMIISPNKVFSDYISNVLPELGEESIPEMEMETIAKRILGPKIKFETFFDQVNRLLEEHEPEFIERISFKAGKDFLSKLNKYVDWVKKNQFCPHEIQVRFKKVSKEMLGAAYHRHSHLPQKKKSTAVARDVLDKATNEFNYFLRPEEKSDIQKQVKAMFGTDNYRVLYREFYDWLDASEMLRSVKQSVYEYADVFPLIYLKMQLEGQDSFSQVKHLIVDEMQDYTAVQYAVIAKLFPSQKTILGDANQDVNPYSSITSTEIQQIFPNSKAVTLKKSYRSTKQITEFTMRVSPKADVETVERHGDEPEILSFGNTKEEMKVIAGLVQQFRESERQSLGILCKTQQQAKKLHAYLKKLDNKMQLVSPGSLALSSGALVTSAHLAKGLEFDEVIVPHVDSKNYQTDVDISMLYIACTRAMHKLTLTHCHDVAEVLS